MRDPAHGGTRILVPLNKGTRLEPWTRLEVIVENDSLSFCAVIMERILFLRKQVTGCEIARLGRQRIGVGADVRI